MSVTGRRPERLGHEIRVILAELMVRGVKDPRVGFVTITRVEVTPDLHHARVYVSVLGSDEEKKASLEGLASAAGFLRHEVSHQLDLRRTPELSFIIDPGAEAVERIDRLLQQVNKEEH
jgi:ribosome-binding factor A